MAKYEYIVALYALGAGIGNHRHKPLNDTRLF